MMLLAKKYFLAIILLILILSCTKKDIYVQDQGQETTEVQVFYEKDTVSKLIFTYNTAIHKIELGNKLEELKKGKKEDGVEYRVKLKKNDTVIFIKTIDLTKINKKDIHNMKSYKFVTSELKKEGFVKK